MKRREAVTLMAAAGFASSVKAAEPWAAEEVITPADLAKRIEAGDAPATICVAFPVLYRQRHIRGARYAGPGNKPEGIQDLEKMAAKLNKDQEVVLYCGCCPMAQCPNIRPAYAAMKKLGFRKLRVLDIPTNMHTDWSSKGYPVESSPVQG